MIKNNSALYRVISFLGVQFIASIEWVININSGKQDFYSLEKFHWVKSVEAHYSEILSELNNLLNSENKIHDFSKLSEEQKRIVKPEKWKSFILYAYGNFVYDNCNLCPNTTKTVRSIQGMKTAMFSVFEPGTHLLPHRGPYNGLLRYHLALMVPENYNQCGIKLNNKTYHWKKGESIIFDDTYEHEAWNYSQEKRVVLFVDFEKPLPFYLRPLNRIMIWLIGSSPFVKNILKNINRLDR
jgi:ornithine lipid ester-linked acyl 2-hydroxylase